MRAALALAVLLAACGPPSTPGPEPVADPNAYASPLMGTGGFAFFHGAAFVGAAVPHGLVKLGPDTRGQQYGDLNFIHYSGYWAGDDTVTGFSHLHMHGTGARDWGTIIVMPVTSTDPSVLTKDGYQSKFSKRGEKASPGSYEVTLAKWNVKAELTASTHAGHHRYTFADGVAPQVVLDLSRGLGNTGVSEQTLTEVDATTLRGSMLVSGQFSSGFGGNRVFFEVRTNRAYSVTQRSADGHVLELGFAAGEPVELLVGVSLVSQAGATANLSAEFGDGFTFDAHRDAAAQAWRTRLSRARVFGGSEEDRATFYSALRLAFLMPTTISDVDGAYVYGGAAGSVGAGEVMLSDFSLWDTYRTVHPLYSLLAEDSARWSVQSLLRMSGGGRGLPRWPQATGEAGTMVGAPADIVFADAVLRGVPGVDGEALWAEASSEAMASRGSRAGMGQYATLGYVPLEESGRSVGITVEYAHADFALANLGRALGHTTEAAAFETRSKGWRKLFDPANKVLRPRTVAGVLDTAPYTFEGWDGYAEANATQTTYMPTWDLDGMDALFGSRDAFLTEFQKFFDEAPAENAAAIANTTYELRWLERYHYWPSNEPDIHTPFVFAIAGRPELAAKWVDWARDTFFSAQPDGVPGNDDGGTLGSWFVFAAAGLYPIPGTDQWVLGSPIFPKLELTLPGGHVLTVEAKNVSAENIYVQGVTLDGVKIDRAVLNHSQLVGGSKLSFDMGSAPSTWAH
ncbi:MAG: GH92 family glycosyl hydrolase [Archangium sp.]